ncbi:uncharacterized protein LOC128242491 [Mya arenaria]|uniref:uncharacterized protein LOC128242491 n=1 Tax=Mya arenaria TaxID=6604 RepID=UPI0022E1905E|nr:uncharacterized protein LOC128242491 [Mya arenaria]
MNRQCVDVDNSSCPTYEGNECGLFEVLCYEGIPSLEYCSSECRLEPITVNLALDGDFYTVTRGLTDYEIKEDVRNMFSSFGISVQYISNIKVLPGSIIIALDLSPFPEMDSYLLVIKEHFQNGGTFSINGHVLPLLHGRLHFDWIEHNVENYTTCLENEELCLDSDGTAYCSNVGCVIDDPECNGENELYCFMSKSCVNMDTLCTDDKPCLTSEVLCHEGIPSLEYCSSECHPKPITVNLALDGDFYTVTRGLTDYEIKEDVRNMFSSFGISVQYISNIKFLPGSIIIALDLSPFPEMDSYLLVIKEHFQNGGTFSINGHVLPLLHGRLHFDWIEHNVDNYTTCLEIEELCLDSDGTAYCSNEGCVIDDPECDGENELYCFMSKSCVNMDTLCTDDKPCLTSEFVCVDEGGETFCSEEPCDTTTTTTPTTTSTKTTTTTESSEITDPPGPASFHATIRLVLEIRYQKIIMPANTDNGSTAMEEFKSRMRAQLEEQVFRTVQFDAIGVTAQPGDPDGDTIALYIKGRHPPEEGIQNLIMEKLGVAKLYGEHGDSIGIRLDGISYAKVFDEVPNTFFVLPDPIVRDQEYSFMLSDILPTDITDIPSELDIDCGENSVEFKNTEGEFEDEANVLTSTPIIMRHTRTDVTHQTCFITDPTSPENLDVRAFVFLTVPQTLDALASDVEILLNKEQIDLEEDSGCTGFPEDLFSFQTPVDEIITVNENWHLDQISDEMILKAKQGVGNIIEAITKRAFMEKIRAVNRTSVGVDISRASLLTERQQMKAKLRLDSRDVEDSGFRETHIYSRPQSLKICPSKDFSGSFILNIGDGKFLLDVTVLPTPDRPHRIPSVADIDIHNVFAYPMVPSAIAEPEVPVFSVGEIASNLFFDTDSDSSLGLAFFGYLPSEIGGRWEYSSDEETWIAFAEVQPPSSRSELRDVITLGSSYFFRFTPDETSRPLTWTSRTGPQIVLAAFDAPLTYATSVSTNIHHTVTIEQCKMLDNNYIGSFCTSSEDVAMSKAIVVLKLPRTGCDSIVNSGKTLGVCGCGDELGCLDCNGQPNGEAKYDICGRCVQPGDALNRIDCSLQECLDKHTEYCELMQEKEELLTSFCEVGHKQSLFYDPTKPLCNAKCIPETEPDTAPRDDCDIPCGLNECVDCEGIPNGGKVLNLCGQCKDSALVNEGCAQSVGDISPRFAYQADDIVLNIRANGLTQAEPICQLLVNGIETTAPTVLSHDYQFDNNNVLTGIKLAVNATGTSGQFAVECEGVSTADHDEFFQVIQQPQLTGISPDSADIDQLGDVTITGSSLLLVQNIYCVANMYNSDTDASFRTVKAVLGVDGDTIKCSMKDLLGPVRRGKTFKVGVTLMEPSTALMKRVDSFVEFTVVMPAPSVVSAVLDTSGCNKIKLTFDQPISKGVDEQCANYLSSTTLSDLSLTDSVCMVYGNTLVMKYATVIPDGSVLTLKENAIAHAFEFNTENIHYASGQVTLQADTSGEGTPDVLILRDRIPDVVGCTDVAIVLRVSNAGCWNPTYSWTITVENQDTATEEVTASIAQLEEASRKNVFVINATMMVDNILYSFTVTWEAGPHSGTDTVNIRRDASLEAMVNIYGVQQGDLVDADSRIPLSCDLETCVEVNGIEYEWSVDPVYVIPDNAQKRRPVIPSGWLKYDTEHEVTCKVKYSGQDISTSVTFTTKPKSLEPRITVSGQAIHSPSIEHTFAEDLQLGCMDLEDAMNTENLNCIYMCENNLYGEETFLPCRELVNGQVEDVVRDGLSAVVPANDRIKPSDRDLKEKWTLTLQRGKSTKSTTLEIQYKSVPIVVKAPVINVKDNVLAVKSSDETLTIKARCKQMKKYVWNPESAKDNADLSLMPLHESDLLDGRLERALQYDEMLSFPCGIEIDLTRFSLVPGEQYGLVIEGYNVQDGYQLTARELIRISVVSVPIAGSIEIFYDGNELRALSTPITIQLHNWWDDLDGDDLRCWFYYFAEGGVEQDAIKLNPHPNSLLQGLKDFTLPEGNFKVGARCCNSYRMCSSALTETTLSVTAIESQNIVTIVFDLGKLVINGGSDDILTLLLNVAKAFLDLSSNDLTLEESEQTDQVLTDASNDAITDALEDVEDDIEYGFEVLGSSSAVVKQNPAAISSETKDSIMRTGSELGRRRTGQSVNRRRKRRSTECQEYSNPSGIQQTQAVTLLEAYDVTISETTMSSVEANLYLNLIENIMIGMCQAFSGLDAWTAPAEKAYVRVHTTDMSIIGTGDVLVSCANCAEVTHPAKVQYGGFIKDFFNDTWACAPDAICNDVCIASVQLNVDTVSLTAPVEIVPPTRKSDLVILKFINPETYCEVDLPTMDSPLQVKLTLEGPIDTELNNYKCLMWLNDDWLGGKCTETDPTFDSDTGMNITTCTCNAVGIIGVFEILKTEDTTDMSSTTATNSAEQTTVVPSKSIQFSTDFLLIVFTFTNNFDVITSMSEFKDNLKQQIYSQTGVPVGSIQNLELKQGSIIVSFELIESSGSKTLGQMAYTLETTFTSNSVSFTSPDGQALTFKTGSFAYTEKSLDDENDDDDDSNGKGSKNLLLIIGGVLGGLIIIGVVVVVVVLIIKHNNNKRTYPVQHHVAAPHQSNLYGSDPAPPTYSAVPPPPAYYNPPATNKWVENEIDVKQDGRAASDLSNRSSSSFEKRLQRKANEQTPVG